MPNLKEALGQGHRLSQTPWEGKRSPRMPRQALLPSIALSGVLSGCVAQPEPTPEITSFSLILTNELKSPETQAINNSQQLVIQGLKEKGFQGDFGQPTVIGVNHPDYLLIPVIDQQTKEPTGTGVITYKDENGQIINRWVTEVPFQTQDGRWAASLIVLDQETSDFFSIKKLTHC